MSGQLNAHMSWSELRAARAAHDAVVGGQRGDRENAAQMVALIVEHLEAEKPSMDARRHQDPFVAGYETAVQRVRDLVRELS